MADATVVVTFDQKLKEALDGAYRERAHLVALLAAHYPSHIGHNDQNAPDWAVVTVELPAGQACWHIAPADLDLFEHVQPTSRICRGWDGHTTEEKYRRIRDHAARFAADVAALPHSTPWPAVDGISFSACADCYSPITCSEADEPRCP